ncbi:hypothetical protein [Sphingobacterium yanglingense]|uniref:Uncharacterized protein n=1 Tax=Sphingobacterium yanglingense TaxID=1437280 RepID=A0A4R6WHC7_9SPHI|nr:hypothetical protein [Sphingobacterium yanglingense]TDQ79534.1 hypothetical protein CLV99_0976 [Sphingobacterium yanglingense]
MGCDIHIYVEYKTRIKDSWNIGDYFIKTENFDSKNGFERIEIHGNRDYSLFTTLAGVRDYSGRVVPVAEPKGLPSDLSAFVKSEAISYDSDGHTHSWLTLKELKQYQSTEPTISYSGLLSKDQQRSLDKYGILPNSWCQGTNQEGYERREWSENNESLIPLIEKLEQRAKELFSSSCERYDSSCESNIRIVFWFDN